MIERREDRLSRIARDARASILHRQKAFIMSKVTELCPIGEDPRGLFRVVRMARPSRPAEMTQDDIFFYGEGVRVEITAAGEQAFSRAARERRGAVES